MKLTFVFLLFALVVATSWSAPSDNKDKEKDAAWADFKNQHKKKYETPEKESKSRANFNSNEDKIKRHNTEYAAGNQSWFMRHNQFSDMSEEEFRETMLRPVPPMANTSHPGAHVVPLIQNSRQLVATVDWLAGRTNKGVRNQGICGCCYSFATIGVYEWYYYNKYGLDRDFSEQQVVSCSSANGNLGCNGGTVPWSLNFLMSNGVALESAFLYQQLNSETVVACKSVTKTGTLVGYSSYPSSQQLANDQGLMNAMNSAKGPVAINIYASSAFQAYGGGYFDYACSGVHNHAVIITGYGTMDGKPYWLVKNSWGTTWGAAGFMYLKRGVNHCNVGSGNAWWPNL